MASNRISVHAERPRAALPKAAAVVDELEGNGVVPGASALAPVQRVVSSSRKLYVKTGLPRFTQSEYPPNRPPDETITPLRCARRDRHVAFNREVAVENIG